MTATLRAGESHARHAFVLSVAALALLASINVLPNGFTYDDRFVIVANPAVVRVHDWKQFFFLPYWPLHQGGDGYRPLTTLLFALQWATTHDPWLFHAVSVVLYVACSVAVFWLARLIVSPWCAWWTAALFAAHPVHVEATAGVVGQSELAAGLAIIVATGLYLSGRQRGTLTLVRQVSIAGVFVVACLFKEHAIVTPLLLFLVEWAFVRDASDWTTRLRAVRVLALLMGGVIAVYLAARMMIVPLGVLGFAPYTPFVTTEASPLDRAVTMLGIVPHWIRLLLFPARLSTEYGPPRYAIGTWGRDQWIGVVALFLVAYAIIRSARGSRTVAFALLWTAILLIPVSNVLFPSGVLLAERTLFAPSLGACLLVAVGVVSAGARVVRLGSLARVGALVAGGAVLLFGITRSIIRAADWRDNESLFSASVRAEPEVYRSHYMLGAWYLESGKWPSAERELQKAMALFDRDPAVAYNLGVGYFGVGDFARAFEMFQTVQQVMPGVLDAKTKMALALAAQGKLGAAKDLAAAALAERSESPAALQAVIQAAILAEKVDKRNATRP